MGVGVVLIHGAAHTAVCWQSTVAELARSAPDLPALAVDLPGRGDTPEHLQQVTVQRCVEHVVERIETAQQRRFVLAQLCDESSRLDREPVRSAGLLDPARTAWVLPRRDRTVRPRTQLATIERLGIDDVTEVDAGQDLMVSHPQLLASILQHQAERLAG